MPRPTTVSRLAVIASILIVTAASAVASPGGGASANGDRLICKRQAKTGTRFPSKICHTKAEWDKIAEQTKRDAAEMMNKPTIDISRGN